MSARILIVDDHEIVRRGLRTLLSSRPEWKVCGEATDGFEAIEKAKDLHPDVVLMDISMPRMNGLEATRIIRRDFPQSKVVIISQNDSSIARRQAQAVDAAAYVAKTDLFRHLLPTISKFLSPARTKKVEPDLLDSLPASAHWLGGGGTLGAMIRRHDWSDTALGPIQRWPQSLKTAVTLILNARHPMWVGWGREAAFLYNDAYIPVLSMAKHPWALGQPAAEVWPEVWDIVGPLIDKVYNKGEASYLDDVRFLMNRGDFVEETYYSFSYSPIRDESGAVAGLFCPTTEVTSRVISARRSGTLAELSAEALVQKTTEAVCESIAAALAKNPEDIPFALLYLIDPQTKQARLEQACGVPRGLESPSPSTIDLSAGVSRGMAEEDQGASSWPLAEVVRTGHSQVFSVQAIEGLPLGVAQQRLSQAMILPVASRGDGAVVGVLIAGVSPARKLDAEYRGFYELLAGQIATAIQNVRDAEEERERMDAQVRSRTKEVVRQSDQLRDLSSRLLQAQDQERRRIARELHDSAGQILAALSMSLAQATQDAPQDVAQLSKVIDESHALVRQLSQEIRTMSYLLHPPLLDEIGLLEALRWYIQGLAERSGLEITLDLGDDFGRLSPEMELVIFRLVQECLTNIHRHSGSSSALIRMKRCADSVSLEVADKGRGIPPEKLSEIQSRGSGVGIRGMRERVHHFGGRMHIESGQHGTTTSFTFPLAASDTERSGREDVMPQGSPV